jgi:hypothetical protein
MVKLIIGFTTASFISAILMGQTAPVEQAIEDPAFLAGLGISQPVYDCAKNALAGYGEQQLIDFIKTLPDNTTSDARTTIEACVKADPFGFAIDGITPDEQVALNYIQGGK